MVLPSIYSHEGLSRTDANKPITSGKKRENLPTEYTLKTIDDRVQAAVEQQDHDGDIEMVPMENEQEVDLITSYVSYSRDANYYDDDLNMNIEHAPDFSLVEGNISFLIIDTNFCISHLTILDELNKIANDYGLMIIIPVYVIQELDGLKNSTKLETGNESVRNLARWANEWIYNQLANGSTIVKGQKLNQRLNADLTKDDAILDCCLYFQHHYAHHLIVLLSNDKNLCSKALMHEILTVSFRQGMEAKLIGQKIMEESLSRFGQREAKYKLVVNHEVPTQPQSLAPEITEVANTITTTETSPSTVIYTEIQTLLSSVLHRCMVAEYQEDLDLIRDYKKDNLVNLRQCSQLLIRFWSSVFQQYFKAMPGRFVPFEEIGQGRRSKKIPVYTDEPTPQNVAKFVAFWSAVLKVLYHGIMNEQENEALDIFILRWKDLAPKI
ncbi:unnamed protein product [Candida parapsilosis]|uniref:Transcriptional protein SWT1 n=1 Tax=Candida parapsilosis (strain CDC 317 / ATCC MYA-4646) TaxID=578454 RepID=G8B921_CANPC|nr:uncharacterized protein CPAR2_301090 [Candida parapsilosis]CCE41120.1 hypothetical protein CPAR2_301090 [Candida parapsilosis]